MSLNFIPEYTVPIIDLNIDFTFDSIPAQRQTIMQLAGPSAFGDLHVYKGIWVATGQSNYSSIPLPVKAGDYFIVEGSSSIGGWNWNHGDYLIITNDVASGGTITSSDVYNGVLYDSSPFELYYEPIDDRMHIDFTKPDYVIVQSSGHSIDYYRALGTMNINGTNFYQWVRETNNNVSDPQEAYIYSTNGKPEINSQQYEERQFVDQDGNVLDYACSGYYRGPIKRYGIPSSSPSETLNISELIGVPINFQLHTITNDPKHISVQMSIGNDTYREVINLSVDTLLIQNNGNIASVQKICFGNKLLYKEEPWEITGSAKTAFGRMYAWEPTVSSNPIIYTPNETPSYGNKTYRLENGYIIENPATLTVYTDPYYNSSHYTCIKVGSQQYTYERRFETFKQDVIPGNFSYEAADQDSSGYIINQFTSGSIDLSTFYLNLKETVKDPDNPSQVYPPYETRLDFLEKEEEFTNTEDYIHFPYFPYHAFSAKNLRDMSDFKILDSSFSGSEDKVDFGKTTESSPSELLGCSLCTKVLLRDRKDKLIYVKRYNDSVYCSLEILNETLVFKVFPEGSNDSPVVLEYPIGITQSHDFLQNEILISVIVAKVDESIVNPDYDPENPSGEPETIQISRKISMYKNNTLLSSKPIDDFTFKTQASSYKLYNYFNSLYAWIYEGGEAYTNNNEIKARAVKKVVYTSTPDPDSSTVLYNANGTTYTGSDFSIVSTGSSYEVVFTKAYDIDENTYEPVIVSRPVHLSSENYILSDHDLYVSDIITFEGSLNTKQLQYLNNVTDTNF